ncbi:MAG: dTMP kinase [Planctomycetales bacterium]
MSRLIAIEGIDGSGKGTQAQRLVERYRQAGISAELMSFPRYDATLFGRAIGEYLNGEYGSLDDVHPFLVSLLFAGDRLESREPLAQALAEHEVVVLDRYVPSNVAHQAAKRDGAQRAELARRILRIEFEIFQLPRPDLVLLLDLPVATAQELIARKGARNYTQRVADLQEADAPYLQRVREVYLDLARGDADWRLISCVTAQGLRSIDEIGEELWTMATSNLSAGQSCARAPRFEPE